MRTAEFDLAVQCCRMAFDPDWRTGSDPVELDWGRFERLARFHRVQGLIWPTLPRLGTVVPGEIVRSLRDDAARIASRNHVNLQASVDLAMAMRNAGLDVLFVKGLPLGVLAYGNPWLKAAVDIDLLVEEARLGEAVAVLRSAGFIREDGKAEEIKPLRAWHRLRKDSEWRDANSTARVDLHTRLTDNPRLIPGVGLHSYRREVRITPDLQLTTLADDEMFAHLCVHGASSAWFRLKWITDLAALLHPKCPEEIARLYRRSQELGAGRAAGQALLLADTLYKTLDHSPGLRGELRTDRGNLWLLRSALNQLAGRAEPIEPTGRFGGTLRIHLTQFILLPDLSFKASELARQFRAAFA